ncbi:MAG: ATP-binding cassette domain-containing protein [Fervidicoccaceae archaeon]|nr:ATP-binding cassette domain-containing protein [Fervidicoccaceae archaeon]
MSIEFVDLYAGYRRGDYVLKGINMRIANNTIILGPNGSGKTTLMRVVLGITVSKKGKILIDGLDVDSVRGLPGLVAANLPEIVVSSRLPVKHVASYYLDILEGDYEYFRDLVGRLGGAEVLEKRLHELSAGLRKIILNAIALATKAKYVLLDEPFENLDPARRVAMLKEILGVRGIKVMDTHATWLLKALPDWDTYLMVEGSVYGPLKPGELEELKVSREPVRDVRITIKLKTGDVYLSKLSGTPLTSLESLDKLYEVLAWRY